jgi:hypothetical protein
LWVFFGVLLLGPNPKIPTFATLYNVRKNKQVTSDRRSVNRERTNDKFALILRNVGELLPEVLGFFALNSGDIPKLIYDDRKFDSTAPSSNMSC